MSLSLQDKLKVVVRTMNEGNSELASAWVQYIAKSEGIHCSAERAQQMCKALDAGVTLQLPADQLTSNFKTSMQQSAALSTTPSPQLTPTLQPRFSAEDKEKHDREMQELIDNAAVKKQQQLTQQLNMQRKHVDALVNAVEQRDWKEAAKEIRELSPQAAVNARSYVPIMRSIRSALDSKANNDELRDAVTWGINPKGITEISGTLQTVVVQNRFNPKMTGKIDDGMDLGDKHHNKDDDVSLKLMSVANSMRKHVTQQPTALGYDPDDKERKVLVAGESAGLEDNKNEMISAVLETAELAPPEKPKSPSPFDLEPSPEPELNLELPEEEAPEQSSMPGFGANSSE